MLKSLAHMVYGRSRNYWWNWVATDSEIINATFVAIDLEINNDNEVVSGFTPFRQA